MSSAEEVRVALSPGTLARLLSEKRVSADDFRCLDTDSKHRVQTIFLRNLLRDLRFGCASGRETQERLPPAVEKPTQGWPTPTATVSSRQATEVASPNPRT